MSKSCWFLLAFFSAEAALADSSAVNLSVEPVAVADPLQAKLSAVSLGLGVDVALTGPFSLRARYQRSLPVLDADVGDLLAGGLRLRFLNDQAGYLFHLGQHRGHEGNLRGGAWLDLTAGALVVDRVVAPLAEVGVGYEVSLADRLSLGPFVRGRGLLDPAGERLEAEAGISFSIALSRAGVHERDTDQDGAIDQDEIARGTNPKDADSDDDGLRDGIELFGPNPTNPNERDSDGDGLVDGHEDFNGNGLVDRGETNPNRSDTDAGGLQDGSEEIELSNPLDNRDDDQDQDGIQDKLDECANTPKRMVVDARGCAIFDRDLSLDVALFASGKSVLLAAAYEPLQRVAVLLKDNPGVKVELGVYDKTGGQKGLALTQARAEAIREYLLSLGVPDTQIKAKGYGNAKPAPQAAKKGKVKAARVELRRLL
jgi:outer membrane protein OmpA-like peptidoglycan-associated protein